YGDILSDVAAQIAGSVGLAGSANIGENIGMFEAIHGSAPRRAGQNLANPSGLLLGAIMMLVHIGQTNNAEKVHNAWLRTIEDGVHTYDIYKEGISKQKVGTKEFAQAVVDRLGKKPQTFCSDQCSCRFMSREKGAPMSHKQIIELLGRVESAGFDFIKIENLCNFDGERGYSLDQGE